MIGVLNCGTGLGARFDMDYNGGLQLNYDTSRVVEKLGLRLSAVNRSQTHAAYRVDNFVP